MSGTFRSTPGVAPAGNAVASNGNSLSANYNVTSAILPAQTGRPLAPGLTFQTVNLLVQGHTFPDQLNSLDLRVGKNLRFDFARSTQHGLFSLRLPVNWDSPHRGARSIHR